MKKILEVLRNGENDIRFHTDLDPRKDPDIINQTVVEVAMAMMTTLWGGNETAVLAMIRALSIADLGVSVNRRQMISFLDDASESLAASLNEAAKPSKKAEANARSSAPASPRPSPGVRSTVTAPREPLLRS
jgi:hypothetical protein